MGKIKFFGYGANRNRSKIEHIIGRDPGLGEGAILEDFKLCYQTLSQIPEKPRGLLQQLYGDNFKAYTLKNGEGIVSGVIWEITEQELDKIKEWEFVGQWREIVEVVVKAADYISYRVLTEKESEDLKVEGIADGLFYGEFDFVRVETKKDQFYTEEQVEKIKKWLSTQD